MRAALRRLRAHPWLSGGTAVVLLAGAATGVYFGTRNSPANAATASTRTVTVTTGTVKQSVSATGTLAPAHEEQLNFLVSGQVTGVSAVTGARVHKGQALATINSAALAASKAQAQASVASAQAKVDSDESSGATSTQTDADTAALTAAKNQLASARSQLAEATLTSPIDGVVAAVNLTVGQSVSGSASGSGNGGSGNGGSGNGGSGSGGSDATSAQVLVISTDSWLVNASVDASSVGLLKTGEQAQLTVTGADATVYGTIASIGLVSSSSSSGTASYPVVVDVTGSPAGLHDGADVTASLIYKQVTGLVIPTTALHRNTDGSEYVEQVKNGTTVHTTVHVGLSAGGESQITSGLSEGDQVQVEIPQISRSGASNGQTGRNGFGGGNFPGGVILPGGGKFPGGLNRVVNGGN